MALEDDFEFFDVDLPSNGREAGGSAVTWMDCKTEGNQERAPKISNFVEEKEDQTGDRG